MKCKIEKCPDTAKVRGWCRAHYAKWWRYGDPERDGNISRRQPSRVRDMSEPERAYLGALIDGEGHIFRSQFRPRFQLAVNNTELELISAPLRATGVGRVYLDAARNRKNPAYKLYWKWVVTAINDVYSILTQIQAYSYKSQRALTELEKNVTVGK